jgi:hypothetical protein
LPNPPHIFCDEGQQVIHLERFGEKIIGTGLPGHLSRVFMGGEHDDRQTMRGFLAFVLPANRSPICARESDIQEQQIRQRLGHLLRSVSIAVDFHLIPRVREHLVQHLPNAWIIVGDEDSFRHAALLLLAAASQLRAVMRKGR